MSHDAVHPNPWMILPFGVLLTTIALAPLLAHQWWQRNYPKVAYTLGAITLLYYVFGLQAWPRIISVGHEYVSFIALVGSLFVVSGGIHIHLKGQATPLTNVVFLLIGAVISNVLGTTGASMLLIRPWIRMNKYRITAYHIAFFIFIVSNIGGCLTPIGDPPLFLGYLKGIPFWWVAEHCWPMWAVGVGYLLLLFYILDSLNYRRVLRNVREIQTAEGEQWRFEGKWNLAFILLILVSVFINQPVFLREGLMISAALGSWLTTKKEVHDANQFNFHPIQEVAILFVGIFATMMPALDWLENNSENLGNPSPGSFYWACGMLSSMLDNAPTYLSFLAAALGKFVSPEVVNQVLAFAQSQAQDFTTITGSNADSVRHTLEALRSYHAESLVNGDLGKEEIEVAFLLGNAKYNLYIVAISIGAVFFGAATYIGNGPNFMVKSIADHQKIPTPGFLGFVFRYTVPCLAPMLVLLWLLFFRR